MNETMSKKLQLAVLEPVEPLLRAVRGERVILDTDLARIYGVETKARNRAVKRNADRFPPDFALRLSAAEAAASRFQFGTLKAGRGPHLKYRPQRLKEPVAICELESS